MSYLKLVRGFALILLFVVLGGLPALAQGKGDKGDKKNDKPDVDVSDKPRNVKPELKTAYKKWLNEDVPYIITKEEKKAFMAL